jgi:hypothetical protein
MATLDETRRVVFPGARVLSTRDGAGDARVGWVRVLRARVPAFDALETGDLAIIPEAVLATLASGALNPPALVAELVRGGVPGLLLVADGFAAEGRELPAPAAALVEAATAHDLAAFRVVGVDPGSLERSIIGFLVNRRAEVERLAADLVAQVEDLALRGRELDAIAAAIAGFLARSVAIENGAGVAMVVHAPEGVPDAAASAARYLAQPRTAALRVPLPGGGILALLGSASPSELEQAVARRVAPLLALEITRGLQLRRALDAGRADRLPADGPPWVVIVARQVAPEHAVAIEERMARRDRIAALYAPGRLALRGDVSSLEYRIVVAVEHDDALGLRIAGRVATAVERLAAVSRPFRSPEERPTAEAEARSTLEAVEELAAIGEPAPPDRVARGDRLAAYRLLGQLHNLPGGARLAEALLAPLRVGRPTEQAERIATLRALLDHQSAAGAAQSLGIHRNTLLYRTARIEAITGWRLDDPQLRTALSLALRIVQKDQDTAQNST